LSDQNNDVLGFSYFGKLPQYADFIKHNAGSKEFSFLDEWLQSGIASAKTKLKNDWKEIYNRSNAFDFFFPVKQSNNVIAGVLFPGKDKSGREFPFIVFSIVSGKFFNAQKCGSISLQLNSFSYTAKRLLNIAINSSDINQTNREFSSASSRLIPAQTTENIFNEYLSSTSVNELLTRTANGISVNSGSITEQRKSFSISFSTDEDNYNFDTGFFIYLSSLISRKNNSHQFIFKSKTDDYKVNLHIYFDQPEADEFSKIISIETTNSILSLLQNTTNTNISLKEFIDEQRLH
jgi:type VI secretion system ImpM family protein